MTQVNQVIRPEEIDELLKSSSRTVTLLELFAEHGGELTVGEISNHMKIPQSSASSLIKSLTDSGYLIRHKNNRKISVSPRLGFLGAMSAQHAPSICSITKKAADISAELSETVIVAMRNGVYSQYIYIHRALHQSSHEHVTLGSLRPLVCSATGWAMLLDANNDEVSKLIRVTRATVEDSHWLKSAKDALGAIKETKTNGFAFSQGPSKLGTAGIAVPLQILGDQRSFSIGVASNTANLTQKKDAIVSCLLGLSFPAPHN
jgi:DNA-binding IclR family transcriptional regulator